jgi:hypothetical protein
VSTGRLLVTLSLAGSALAWWPVAMKPSLYLTGGLPLVIVALLTAFSTILSCGHWPRFMVSSGVGTFVGLWTGWAIWQPTHSIATSYVLLGISVATLAALLVSLTVGLAVRKVSLPNEGWRVPFWISLACCLATGPIALALTPSLIARRVSRNERVAAERFQSLKSAVEQTKAETGNPRSLCDGSVLKSHYSGPPFSRDDWDLMNGNYVIEDGYFFGIWCQDENGGYTIDARPETAIDDGMREFCTDESGRVGCSLNSRTWPRKICVACAQ